MAVRRRTPFPHLVWLTVPMGGVVGVGVALSSAHRWTDAWAIWCCAAVSLTAASGAIFVHGLRRWAELTAIGAVPLPQAIRPVIVLYVTTGVVLVALLHADLVGAWRALVLIAVAGCGLAPGAVTMAGVGHLAAVRDDTDQAPPGLQLSTLIVLGRLLQSLLTAMGAIVALLVIAEATSQRMTDHTSVETTLVFGAGSSALVGIVYTQVSAKLRQRGRELVDLCHPLGPLAPNELADALDKRSRLETALGVDRTAFSDIQANLVVVGPLLAGAASAFLVR